MYMYVCVCVCCPYALILGADAVGSRNPLDHLASLMLQPGNANQ